jgi:predicted TIM-barrel fold metal-dependent hydrolase
MSASERLAEPIAEIRLVDHHCHAPQRLHQQVTPQHLRQPFTESTASEVVEHDVPHSIAFRAMLRWLARLLGTDPTEPAVLAARARYELRSYHRLLADDARIAACYDDHLYDEERCYAPAEWAALIGRPVRPIVRIETVAERLVPHAHSWDDLRQRFCQELAIAAARGAVGFKSIAAYRSGLQIERVDAASADQAFLETVAEIDAGTFRRLEHKTLVDALLWQALEVAAELGLPLQFHVGLGDDDVFLPISDPTLLRPLFQEARYRHVPLVLLHCYPFVRQAAYLASIYPNAYVDLGLTLPLAAAEAAGLVREALGLAPANKILASTDGHSLPEFQWFAARLWRAALTHVLGNLVDEALLTDREALEIAAMILHANAERIYPAERSA